MKLKKDMVHVPFGSTTKILNVAELEIDGVPLQEIYDRQSNIEKLFEELIIELKDKHIVSKDASYIIEIDGKLQRVKDLKLFEEQATKFPLNFYKVEDGNIILDKKKVGAL
jgi:hypothetical protein